LTARAVETLFHLARAWQLKGDSEVAAAGFRRALRMDPRYVPAYVELAGLMLRQGRTREALEYYEQALALGADDGVRFRHAYVTRLIEEAAQDVRALAPTAASPTTLRDNPRGKLDLRHQVRFSSHRSGWGLALDALAPLHNRRGVLFDGFIEQNFAWRHWMDGVRPAGVLQKLCTEGTFASLATSEEQGITPYRRPWVGLLHNPQGMPDWFHPQESPQTIFAKDIWKRSLDSCLGLFTLSAYHGQWVWQQTGKPVSVLTLPTEIPPLQFDVARFMTNRQKKIIQIGWWLRKLNAIYQLPIARDNPLGYEKIRLIPHFFGDADRYLTQLMVREAAIYGLEVDPAFATNTRELHHIPAAEYDMLLAENVAFVDLYDASANNAVIECIARATPLLVNPLPAVVEYLGPDYPLYFTSLDEAAAKALDAALIVATHRYLLRCETRQKLSGAYFRRSVEQSEVYLLL
jgi:tetratricopeptide (TPR) repeat protein